MRSWHRFLLGGDGVVGTCAPFGGPDATAARSIQQAKRMWAGRAGSGAIGRAAVAPQWPPPHSANERRADRTRPATGVRGVASSTRENTRFDLLGTPGCFFLCLGPRYHSACVGFLIRWDVGRGDLVDRLCSDLV
ncbi:unnamed protein product, partial [Iphiclides podalirius]